MNLIRKKIDDSEFTKSVAPKLFVNKHLNRAYEQIVLEDCVFNIAWESDAMAPVVLELKKGVYSVGIDLHFAIVDFNKCEVVLNIELDSFFYDFKKVYPNLFVVCELEVICTNLNTLNLTRYDLPDYVKNIEIFDDKIRIIHFSGFSDFSIL